MSGVPPPPPLPGPPGSPGGYQPPQNAPGAVPALVLGILSLVLCPVLAPFAIAQGRRGEQEVDASGGALQGRGMATTGKVLGIIGCVVLVAVVLSLIAVGIIAATAD